MKDHAELVVDVLLNELAKNTDKFFESQSEHDKQGIQLIIQRLRQKISHRFVYSHIGIDGSEPYFTTDSLDRLYEKYSDCVDYPIALPIFKKQIKELASEIKAGHFRYICHVQGEDCFSAERKNENDYTLMVFKLG